ncbi:MAG: glycoside hydrolase family 32 protein [Chloroflexi bacterium]|nr:glycoside hydrolase family 32 protein [Chloroflexota bacterium]
MSDFDDYLMESYELREKLVADKFRPRYHFVPPEGRWNDINGAIYWKGRYHLGYLQKIANGPGQIYFSSWQHISSRDLLHWRFHKASLREPLAGAKGDYFNSGDVMEGTDPPAIITNMPTRGICIYQCHDDNLDHWVPLAENPVIPLDPPREGAPPKSSSKFAECVIFDPSGWKEGDFYFALVGNKNHRPGYEGDSTSLFKSKDLKQWEYVGPFYKSDRRWTAEVEDCACSNFFPFGDKHMLLMHTHWPYNKAQYYIGRYAHEQFIPEIHGQLSHLGSLVAGPETLVDDRGRRIFWGWIRDAREHQWEKHGWAGVMTLPWHFTPAADNSLRIDPVTELRALRCDERRHVDVTLSEGEERTVQGFASDCMEIELTIEANDAARFGLKVLCSPGGREETVVTYDAERQQFVVDFERASEDQGLTYGYDAGRYSRGVRRQVVPFTLEGGGRLDIDLFVDRSVIEMFVNSRICIVQRVYPTRDDSKQFKLFTEDRPVRVTNLVKWEMDATNPW